MKKLTTIGVMLITLILVSGLTSQAQDFNALLDAVEKIESNLKQLVEQEADARTQDMAKLRLQLKAITSNKSGVSEADLGTMASELEYLRQEVSLWKSFFEQNKAALASLEGGTIPTQDNSKEIQDLSERLVSLSETLDQVVTSSKEGPLTAPQQSKTIAAKGPKTSVKGRVYSHGMMDFSEDSDNYNEFALSRAYVTLKSKLSDYASIRITSDFKAIDDKYNIILKYAYLDWNPGFTKGYAKLRFGLQATQYIDQMNKLWGRRYIEKTVGDKRKFLTSSDLGVSTILSFGKKSKFGFASVALLNGSSYSHIQEVNSNKDFNFVSLVKPFKLIPALAKSALMLQVYSGTQNKNLDDLIVVDSGVTPYDSTITAVVASDWKTQIFSVGGLIAFNSTFDIGFDMNFTTVGKGAGNDAVKKRGLSFFGAFYLNKLASDTPFLKSINFFGRVDTYDPNTDSNGDGETMTVFGIESAPVKGFKVALNYRRTGFQEDAINSNSSLYVNTLFKF